jgi:subtilisin family serine protease
MPGDDMQIPTRDAQQLARDRVRTGEQVQKLSEQDDDIVQKLQARHAGKAGALQFETVGRQNGGNTLVVSRQLVVPESDRRDEAHVELADNRGFVRRQLSEDDPRCEPLHDSVWVYSYEGETDDDDEARNLVDEAHTSLADKGLAAPRTMVTALQMVVKSEGGPAPTTVTVAPFPATGATPDDEMVIAVIDTGIDGHHRADGWLNEVERQGNGDNVDQLDVFPAVGTPAMPILDFGAGHGTFVAGIIRQVDPLAKIVLYRALDSDGLASEEAVASAMHCAAQDGAHIINLSFGMRAEDDNHACPALHAAVAQIQAGPNAPAIVASAGNYGTSERVYPAALHGVVSVAALKGVEDPAGPPPDGADWSSRGNWVRCSAVGEGIVSTFVKGEEDPAFDDGDDVYPEDSWAVWSGTSFAAPQIAALISKTCRQQNRTPGQVVDALFPTNQLPADGFGTRMVLLPGTPHP